jgi:hypothetical protein
MLNEVLPKYIAVEFKITFLGKISKYLVYTLWMNEFPPLFISFV